MLGDHGAPLTISEDSIVLLHLFGVGWRDVMSLPRVLRLDAELRFRSL